MRYVLLGAAMLALLFVASTAQAGERLVKTYSDGSTLSVQYNAATTSSGCKLVVAAAVRKNLGNVLYKYKEQQGWCYNGRKITSRYDYRRWVCCVEIGWKFEGHIALYRTGGSWHWDDFTQGHFSFGCAFRCLTHEYPWVDLDIYGDGGWSYAVGK